VITTPCSLLTSLCLASLCTAPAAQLGDTLPYQGELQRFELDWATGEIKRTSGGFNPGEDAPLITYANDFTVGLYFPAPGPDEHVDWGVKNGNSSGFMSSFELAYGTSTLDTSVGGPGAAFTVTLYSGTLGFCNPNDPGTVVGTFVFSGLPSSPDGFAYGFGMTVDLSSASLPMPDGPIGIGYSGGDGTSGPMLIQVGCCNTGTVDAVDVHKAPASQGPCKQTGYYSPQGNTSFYLTITEDSAGATASATINNGNGVNQVAFNPTNNPVLGTTWQSTVSYTLSTVLSAVAYSAAPATPSPFPLGAPGELLIPIVPLPFLQISTTGQHAIPIPADPIWTGTKLYTQALRVEFLPPTLLEPLNGIDLVLGL